MTKNIRKNKRKNKKLRNYLINCRNEYFREYIINNK